MISTTPWRFLDASNYFGYKIFSKYFAMNVHGLYFTSEALWYFGKNVLKYYAIIVLFIVWNSRPGETLKAVSSESGGFQAR